MSEQDAKDHGLDLDEVYRLVEVATKTMHFPKLAPIHAAAMKALEAHAAALLPKPEPPTVEELDEILNSESDEPVTINPDGSVSKVTVTDRRF